MVIHSSFPDFILFLYVHVAHIDNTYDPRELTTIKSKMAGLFPEGTDLERKLYQTIREYNSFDRSNVPQLCKASFAHFSADKATQQTKLYEDVNAIISADGVIHDMEAEELRKLKELVDQQ